VVLAATAVRSKEKLMASVEELILKTAEERQAKKDAMPWAQLIEAVEQWAKNRQIIPNSNPQSQLLKTMSELGELADALLKNDTNGTADGFGDVLVTLIICAALAGYDLHLCLIEAYNVIKDRKGTLTPEGIFVKEEN
jgi:NTP pyrophosphatase (non-canonical NTP hydrolase)